MLNYPFTKFCPFIEQFMADTFFWMDGKIDEENHDNLSVVFPPGGFATLMQYFLGDPAD